jgi:hypothetical protein
MFKKKNMFIGIPGLAVSVLLIVLGQVWGVEALQGLYATLILINMCMFFFGYTIGGLVLGLCLGGAMAAFTVISLLPESIRGLAMLALLAAMAVISNYKKIKHFTIKHILRKKNHPILTEPGIDEPEEEQRLTELVDSPEIYLIKPNGYKLDVVYKIFVKDRRLYFCRVGGQFYEIQDEIGYSHGMTPEELLKDKRSFSISFSDIMSVSMNPKKNYWTGHIANNGTLLFAQGGRARKFIIHPAQSFATVENFLRKYCMLSPEIKQPGARGRAPEDTLPAEEPAVGRSAARKIAKAVKIISLLAYAFALWLVFYPRPYEVAVVINVLLPLAGLFFYLKYGEVVKLAARNKKDLSNLTSILLFPSIALMLRSLLDFNILYNTNYWIIIFLLAAVISAAVFLMTDEYKTRKSLAVLMPLLFLLYSFGSVTTTNCVYDYSQPVGYRAMVVDKHVDSGKTTTYHLTLEPWGDMIEQTDASVTKKQYDKTAAGDRVDVYEFSGLWVIHWYEVQKPD